MLLWIVLAFMTAVTSAGLTFALLRRRESPCRDTVAYILAAQLAEADSQVAAGDLTLAEAGDLKTEIGRRVLAEGREPTPPAKPLDVRALPYLAIGTAGVVALAATALYAVLGRPDLAAATHIQTPPARDMTTNVVHAGGDLSAMIAQLEAKMHKTPNNPEGWRLLGWSYLVTGRATDAAAAYAHAVALAPHNADYRSSEGEALVRVADGQVTPSALDSFRAALKEDVNDPPAKYYLALYKDQTGDHDGAMADWIALVRGAPAGAPWLPELRRFVENVARERGLNVSTKLPPASARGEWRAESARHEFQAAVELRWTLIC